MAGIHSGDSACCTPPFALSEAIVSQLRSIARQLALRLGVVGLINIQFAIKDQMCIRDSCHTVLWAQSCHLPSGRWLPYR